MFAAASVGLFVGGRCERWALAGEKEFAKSRATEINMTCTIPKSGYFTIRNGEHGRVGRVGRCFFYPFMGIVEVVKIKELCNEKITLGLPPQQRKAERGHNVIYKNRI